MVVAATEENIVHAGTVPSETTEVNTVVGEVVIAAATVIVAQEEEVTEEATAEAVPEVDFVVVAENLRGDATAESDIAVVDSRITITLGHLRDPQEISHTMHLLARLAVDTASTAVVDTQVGPIMFLLAAVVELEVLLLLGLAPIPVEVEAGGLTKVRGVGMMTIAITIVAVVLASTIARERGGRVIVVTTMRLVEVMSEMVIDMTETETETEIAIPNDDGTERLFYCGEATLWN